MTAFAFPDHATIVTPNRRLSAALLKKHQQAYLAQQKTCWQTLDILPYHTWILRLWQQYFLSQFQAAPYVLNPQQELILWEDIITRSPQAEHLLHVSGAAELAKSAWATLKQWRVSPLHAESYISEDAATFQQWANEFAERCEKNQWIDTESAADVVIEKISVRAINPGTTLVLVGFTEFTPQQQYLLDQCKNIWQTNIIYPSAEKSCNDLQKISLSDTETEITTMARWAKSQYTENPVQKIGCIVPNLEKMRDSIVKLFADVFMDQQHFSMNTLSLPFNISAGKSLASYPVIYTALEILSLTVAAQPLEKISYLLRSPFLGHAESEQLARANFDVQLKRKNVTALTLEQVSSWTHAAHLKKRIDETIQLLQKFPEKTSAAQWSTLFNQQLLALGWPGQRSLDSEEYQVVQRFLALLSEFASNDVILPAISQSQTLHYFNRLVNKTIFQPQSPEAPIQILGILEAADIEFDATWVMGLDDHTWPAAPKPNPFIPLPLQKKLNMPHASAERELHYCIQLMKQLKNSTQKIIFSHAEQDGEVELHESALLHDIPEMKHLSLPEILLLNEKIYASKSIETCIDDQAPSIQEREIKGGSHIFKLQAACPFRAFAELRLHAKPIEMTTLGLRPQDRGKLLHRALEMIWKELQDHATLNQMSAPALQSLIDNCVEKTLAHIAEEYTQQQKYFSIEKNRLKNLLADWLAIEKSRPPFTVVALEKEMTATIGKITFSIRVDRIDQVDMDKKLIIDYKTGKYNLVKNWFSERPEEPQLPLYCIVDMDHPTGIAFAQITAGEMTLKGIAAMDLGLTSIKTITEYEYADANNWAQQLQSWKTSLTHLGEQFYQGYAAVDPKEDSSTCEFCQLQPLCRIYEIDETHDDNVITQQ